MPVLQCTCAIRIETESPDDLHDRYVVHLLDAHADWEIKQGDVDTLLRIMSNRPDWDGNLCPLARPLDIRPVLPGTTGDFVRFFEGEGFMDNPLWATCYCMFPNFTGSNEEWSERTGLENLADKVALFKSGDAHGLLAFGDEGQPVAWCAVGPKAEMGNLPRILKGKHTEADGIGSIFCFVVAPPYRRQGVATRLLDAACDYLRGFQLDVAEAYPAKSAGSDAHAFHGPLEMYLQAGFATHGEAGDRMVVRRPLT
ncbi:MAG: GNAT family N-acetyltransferase [Tepidiformaceae bacterium]